MTGPSPLYNSQVEPYAQLTGPYDYVAAGAALRDQGYGKINLTWPGAPSTSRLVAAYMIWSIMNNTTPPSYGTVNGVNVTGSWTAYATPSPCWSPTYIYTFVADVTPDVKNGINVLTGFPSGITTGADPWSSAEVTPMDEGASLIAVYDSDTSATREVTVYTGALTTEGSTLVAQLNYSTTNSPNATTTYIIEDGQLPGNTAVWNGTILSSDAFPGGDPKESTAPWSYGNLSDTKTYNVTVTNGSNNTTAETYPTDSDCFTWVGQVVSVGVPAMAPPYVVDFEEQGLPNGVEWNVTTDSTEHSGTVSDFTSSISFDLPNGSYSYTVPSIPGFIATGSGAYSVQGGPVFLRVLFHELLYPITFNETGLPSDNYWFSDLVNSTQALNENLTEYTPQGMLFEEPNGTYQFTAGESGLYLADPAHGTISVDGGAVEQTVAFRAPPLYNVTFVEQGLPKGMSWGGETYSNWGEFDNSTTNASFVVPLPNTTTTYDTFYVRSVPDYAVTDYLYFEVKAAAEMIDVNFTAQFTVSLVETGLPSETLWYANLTGTSTSVYGSTYNGTVAFSVVNGSYTFSVTHVWGYVASPITGPVTVDGSNVTVDIVFAPAPTFPITFTETGLAPGTLWSVELFLPSDGTSLLNSTTDSIVFSEPNGSYEYTVLTVLGYTGTPVYGYPEMDGAALAYTITFSQLFYVTFDETGLPSGYDWYGYLNGSFGASVSNTIVFPTTNGSQPFSLDTVDTFVPTPAPGPFWSTGRTSRNRSPSTRRPTRPTP